MRLQTTRPQTRATTNKLAIRDPNHSCPARLVFNNKHSNINIAFNLAHYENQQKDQACFAFEHSEKTCSISSTVNTQINLTNRIYKGTKWVEPVESTKKSIKSFFFIFNNFLINLIKSIKSINQ